MKRSVLAGLLAALLAGSAAAQSREEGRASRSSQYTEADSSEVVLKGVSGSDAMDTSTTGAILAKLAALRSSDDGATELAKCDGCGQEVTDCCCEDYYCWTVFGEWLLLQPRGADAVFAGRALNCVDPPLATEQIDFGDFSGFRAGFARALSPSSDMAVSFMMFEAQEEERAAPTTGTDVILPLLFHPTLVNCPLSTSTRARASAGIDFDRINIDYRSRCCWKGAELDWLIGFGYGKLEQDLDAIFDEGSVAVDVDLHGYGLRLGGGASYGLCGCVRGYAHSDLTLLASNVDARFRNRDIFDGQEVDFNQDLDRIVPILDIEVGLAVDLTCHTTVKVGYLYSIWWNVVTAPDFAQDVQAGDISGNDGDPLTFDGVFARVEISF